MTKREFLSDLGSRLSGLPAEDAQRSLEYYSEMIDDRVDDGLSEEEAVAAIGSIEGIAGGILSDVPLTKIVKEKVLPKRKIGPWEIVLLVLGAPLWLSLILALAALVLSVYITLWAAVICLYAAVLSLGVCGAAGILGTFFLAAKGQIEAGLLLLGGGLICLGLSIPFFYLSNLAAKAVIAAGKITVTGIKRLFIRKETAK